MKRYAWRGAAGVVMSMALFVLGSRDVASRSDDGVASSPDSPEPSISAQCQPTAGIAPLTIHVTATAGAGEYPLICALVEIDDGMEYRSCGPWPSWTAKLEFDHELTCPGVHVLLACPTISSECWPAYTREWTVTVAAPSFTLVQQTAESGQVRLFTADDIRFGRIDETVVAWGDGSSAESIDWQAVQGGYATPFHMYGEDGAYEATVTNRYVGERCSFDQASTVMVEVGTPNPVEATSWGAVKAIYR